ncbi:MAG: septum formation initiator family protein [Clostridia bacterium]|nr:septum formation initiator family protein [Clostridia bacterium]
MKINIKKLLKKIILVAFIIYVASILIEQQKTLNAHKENIAITQKQIEEANEHKESLVSLKENAHSLEYIEKIAREKLNMYMPNEKVYIDTGS